MTSPSSQRSRPSCVVREEILSRKPTVRTFETTLVLATCAVALVLALAVVSPAFGQSAPALDAGLRSGQGDAGVQTAQPPLARAGAMSTQPPMASGSGLYAPPPAPASYAAGAADPSPNAAINYGKPRKLIRRPLPNPAPKAGRRPLPPLEPYKNSYAGKLRGRADPLSDRPQPLPPTGVAVVPTIPAKAPKKPEERPFEPVGVSLGSLRLKPYVETSGGYDTNPNRVSQPNHGSAMLRGDIGTTIQSEWSRHQVQGELRLGYSDFPGVKGANRPDGAGKIDGKIDVLRDTTIDVGANFAIGTIRPGSPEIQPGSSGITSTNQPVAWSTGGYVGGTHKFNRLEVSLRGTLDRAQTGDAQFSDGSTQRLSLNNYTTLGVKPRVSFELTPGLKPFAEATVDRRVYDNQTDVNGFKRSSNGYAARAGASFELSRVVTGEASGGYVQRDYDDPRLVKLRGPTVDASLIWTASPLTTVTLRGGTTVNETTIANASGAISRKITGEISHALLRNVTLTGTASYQVTSYQGQNLNTSSAYSSTGINERLMTGTIKAEYALTRTVVVKASYGFEKLKTTVAGSDYTANIFLLGLRLQR